MKYWFTSDTHFAHKRICELEKPRRPFSSVEEMDQAIIDNWNTFVSKDDVVYHLGDFCFYRPDYYLDRLNGTINLVVGNHDDKSTYKAKKRFASYRDAAYIKIEAQKIHLFHYKLTVWRSCHHGSWHLFGHSHCSLNKHPELVQGKCLDVGIMGKGFKVGLPWLYSFEEIKTFMDSRPLVSHHENLE